MRRAPISITTKRCAIYTRKSTEEGLDQAFNSLHAQREACEAYARSQQHEGWTLIPTIYDDGGFSGGSMKRPALEQLLADIEAGQIDILLVYKVDRLSRSLADFVQLIKRFDQLNISFVSVTQQFNTSTSMGRLTLNVLLSFAQFEREVTSERIRDKIAASKKKGLWMGGVVPLGFDVTDKQLIGNDDEAQLVNHIYNNYRALGCVRQVKHELDTEGKVSKIRITRSGRSGGKPFSRGALYQILKNPLYIGKVSHKGELFEGKHTGIVPLALWEQVQSRLCSNRHQRKTRVDSQEASLLAGLIEDDAGNPMSPTHTRKGNRRYRYYLSQALLQFKKDQAGSVTRVSANNIEPLITHHLLAQLSNAHALLSLVDTRNLSADHQEALIKNGESLSNQWSTLGRAQKITYIQTIIHKIIVSKERLTVQIKTVSLREILLNGRDERPERIKGTESQPIFATQDIPVQLQRCGIETRLVITNGEDPTAHQNSVKALQVALLKALKWNQALMNGDAETLVELAKRDKVNPRYVNYLLPLAYLAPDIMRSIVKGNVPSTFTLETLKKGLPIDWQDQRKRFFNPA